MTSTMIVCPACGRDLILTDWGRVMNGENYPVPVHLEPGSRTRECFVSGLWVREAEAVVRIRQQAGPRFLLAAHP